MSLQHGARQDEKEVGSNSVGCHDFDVTPGGYGIHCPDVDGVAGSCSAPSVGGASAAPVAGWATCGPGRWADFSDDSGESEGECAHKQESPTKHLPVPERNQPAVVCEMPGDKKGVKNKASLASHSRSVSETAQSCASNGSEAETTPSRGHRSQCFGADGANGVDRPSSPVPSVGEASVTTATTATEMFDLDDTGLATKVKAISRCAHKPEVRNKLLPGCTNNICFLQGNATELSDLTIVKESGFQSEVQSFLPANDCDFPWTSLAGVKKPDYQTSESYGIPDSDSKILGVVAIKSSEAPSENSLVPLKISCGIWLKNEDPKVTRRIITQVVLQVFGKKPLFQNNDVRRNHHSLEGVKDLTPIEAEIRCFFRGTRDEGVPAKINLKDALGKEGLELLTETFKRSNMILTGTSVDFIDYSDIVATRLKKRPQNDLKIIKDKGCKRSWLPGNLFQFNLSEQLAEASKGLEWRTRLDGHIVVLLPWHDRNGSIGLGEAEEALVAPVDTKRRAIYLVPRITLHPVSADPEKLTKYLSDKYKYKVLVKSGKTWEDREPRKARLCLEVVGGDSCMVQFEGDGAKALPQPVNASDLRFARDMRRGGKLSEGQEAATLAPTAIESEA